MKAFLIASALLLGATPALAQNTSDSNSNAGAQAANSVTVIADAGRYAPADTTVHNDGHVYGTPGVGGSYFAGANPCLVGVGAGASGGPVGFNINIGKSDKGCTRRSDAAAWHALGFSNAAVARMCQDQENADAFFAATGFACPGTNKDGRYKLADGTVAPIAFVATRTAPLAPIPAPTQAEPAANFQNK